MTDVRPAWIAGRPETSVVTAEVINPYDGSVVGVHSVPTSAQVEEAVAAAWAVRHEFAATSAALRAEALMHVSRRLTERLEEITELITAVNNQASEREKAAALATRVDALEEAGAAARAEWFSPAGAARSRLAVRRRHRRRSFPSAAPGTDGPAGRPGSAGSR